MNILITGGSSDIGVNFIKTLSNLGHKVFATASNQESLNALSKRFSDEKINGQVLLFNFSYPEKSEASIDELLNLGLDALVLNAWSRLPANKKLHEKSLDSTLDHITTNLQGNLYLLKKILPHMEKNKFGRIVFISSLSVVNGTGRYAPYIAGKSAMEGIMRNIAVDYGEHNICANTLRLGIIKTKRNKKYWQRNNYVERMSSVIPSGRLGELEDIGEAILPFINKNQYINGSCLDIAGGLPCFTFSGVFNQ